ncbi:hypothetical protein BP6252_04532 [Coleophoma cylindrospora]|uniref:Uncharacterized protein n=1 Tax=Coleophoma cylindrospora TaxID=1849047 RepID=A0A3D8S1C3_9HELO|nr:hypothetical protein BP6252_04532 [Coleophoma cylindrospora]
MSSHSRVLAFLAVLLIGVQRCSGTSESQPTVMVPTVTKLATSTSPASGQLTYYYYTITWSYTYWYYTWTISQDFATTELTSTTSTEYTTVSVYESNSAAANSAFSLISTDIILPTPAQLTNPIPVGTSPAAPEATASRPAETPSSSNSSNASTSTTMSATTTAGQSTSTSTTVASGSSAASSLGQSGSVGFTQLFSSGLLSASIGFIIVPGLLMVWL